MLGPLPSATLQTSREAESLVGCAHAVRGVRTARRHQFLIYARRTGGGAESGTLNLLDQSNRTAQPWYQRETILARSKRRSLRLPRLL
jgi:hypothetical protein